MRLIDADALKGMKFSGGMRDDDWIIHVPLREVMKNIDDAPTVCGWISVKDRLPGCDDGVVLAIAEYDDGWCTVLAWRNEKTGWDTDDPLFEDGMEVTHWMPLPEPPTD